MHAANAMLYTQSRHYDWKLRAIKTTLYVAGGMKRAAPDLSGESLADMSGILGFIGIDYWQCFVTLYAALICTLCALY